MKNFPELCPTLFHKTSKITGLEDTIAGISAYEVCHEYKNLRENAPSRQQKNKQYFVGHTGVPCGKDNSNQGEKHLAMALYNKKQGILRPGGGPLKILDYQFPLRSMNGDIGVGEVDLLGVTDEGRLAVIELKVAPKSGRGDTPVTALMEGLRYAAIIEANINDIANEAKRCEIKVKKTPPIVQILGTAEWWHGWFTVGAAGNWQSPFRKLTEEIEAKTELSIECVEMKGAEFTFGGNGKKPEITKEPKFGTAF